MNKDVVSVLEAAYRLEDPAAWLSGVARAAADALKLEGAVAVLYDARDPAWVQIEHMELVGVSSDFAQALFHRTDDAVARLSEYLRKPRVNSVLNEPMLRDLYEADFRRLGIGDAFGINAGDPSGHGCMLVFPDRRREQSSSQLRMWRRIAAHIAAGNRLRRTLTRLAGLQSSASAAEAVTAPSGSVEQATASTAPMSARRALQDALVRIDSARSRRITEERSVELWRGLVSGRWSIVESFERDGKRYYLAYRNDPDVEPLNALSKREQQVLACAATGQSNKLIAYSLGLSLLSVSTLLTRARRKLPAKGLDLQVEPPKQAVKARGRQRGPGPEP